MKPESLKHIGNGVFIIGFGIAVFSLFYWHDYIGFFMMICISGITSGYFLGKYKQITGKTTWLDNKKLRRFFPGVKQD